MAADVVAEGLAASFSRRSAWGSGSWKFELHATVGKGVKGLVLRDLRPNV